MKVKICYTVRVDEITRKAVGAYYGEAMADRKRIAQFCEVNGAGALDGAVSDYNDELRRKREESEDPKP